MAATTTPELTLRCARGAAQQQAVLDAWLAAQPPAPRAVIAEGALFELAVPEDVALTRLAAGCVCCLGLVPLRVTLTRLLRSRPRALLLMVTSDEHLPRLRALIASGDLGPLQLTDPAPPTQPSSEPSSQPSSEPAHRMTLQHIEVEGIRLAVHVRPHADRGRPWLLFAHALASDHTMWSPQLDALAADYALAALDLRGHGASDAPAGPYPLERLADDAVAVMDALSIDRAHVIGLSLGGMVGQCLALRHRARVRSLTLADTTSRQPPGARATWDTRLAAVRAQGMAPLVAPTLERWFTPAFRARAPQVVARIGARIAATAPAGYIGCAHAVVNIDLTDALATLDLPALVIVGRDDAGTPPAMAEAIAQALRGSALVVLDDAAHLSNIEQADRFNAELRRFLHRVDSR